MTSNDGETRVWTEVDGPIAALYLGHGAPPLGRGAVDELMEFRRRAPGMPYAHPTVEHFAPLFVTLGAASDPESSPDTEIEGFFLGLAKRSFQVA